MSGNNDSGSKMLAGIVVGAVIGGIAGVLLAPRPGRETREKMKRLFDTFLDRTREEYEKRLATEDGDGQSQNT